MEADWLRRSGVADDRPSSATPLPIRFPTLFTLTVQLRYDVRPLWIKSQRLAQALLREGFIRRQPDDQISRLEVEVPLTHSF